MVDLEKHHIPAVDKEPKRKRVLGTLGRAGVSLAGGLLAALPVSGVAGLVLAEVHDDSGPLPTTVSAAPGHSSLETGFTGTLYNDGERFSNHGVGVNIRLDGMPDLARLSNGDLQDFIKPFVSLYQDPEKATEGYVDALSSEIIDIARTTELSLAAIMSLVIFLLNKSGEGTVRERKRRMATSIIGMTLISSVLGGTVYKQWADNNAIPSYAVPVTSTDGSGQFEGTLANSRETAAIINHIAPFIEQERERQKQANEIFVTNAKESIDRALAEGTFVPPGPNETLVVFLSDMHSNYDMIEVYTYAIDQINDRYGEGTVSTVILFGDQTYGSLAETGAAKAQAQMAEYVIFLNGNHDPEHIADAMRDAGANSLDGQTEAITDDISVVGGPDPELTKLPALLGFGEDVSRDNSGTTQEEAGEALLAEAEATDATIVGAHEARELGTVIGIEGITKAKMDQFFAGKFSPGNIIKAAIAAYGHWHGTMRYREVPRSGGGNTVVVELPTAGGASGSMYTGNAGIPFGPPQQDAGAVYVTINNETGLVTGLQQQLTRTTGQSDFEEQILTNQFNDVSRDKTRN